MPIPKTQQGGCSQGYLRQPVSEARPPCGFHLNSFASCPGDSQAGGGSYTTTVGKSSREGLRPCVNTPQEAGQFAAWVDRQAGAAFPALPAGPGANNSSLGLSQCWRPEEKGTRPLHSTLDLKVHTNNDKSGSRRRTEVHLYALMG